jgi:hypothetical protein
MASIRSLVLGGIAAVILIALVMLFLKVTESPAHEVDKDKLARAQANYQRQRAAAERAVPSLPEAPPRRTQARRVPDPEPEPEVVMPDRPMPRTLDGIAIRDPRTAPGISAIGLGEGAGMDGDGASVKSKMDGANKLYDRADYEGAREAALEILKDHPNQTRMLRVVVSASCIMGDADMAEEYFGALTRDKDRDQMSRRCKRYGVDLEP